MKNHLANEARAGKPDPPPFVGIIMTDFPGPLLMDTVTRLNAFTKQVRPS